MLTSSPDQALRPEARFHDPDPRFVARLTAAASGHPQATRELAADVEPQLVAFARARGVRDPEGLANAALFDGLTALSSFRGQDRQSFQAFLFTILRRRIADEYRREERRPATVPFRPDGPSTVWVDRHSSGFEDLIADDDAVSSLLETLTIEQREVVEMRVLTGLSIKETAEQTGRSETAVKAMQRRALTSLRATLLTAAVFVVVVVAGYLYLTSSSGRVTVVDDSPADQSPVEDEQRFDGPDTRQPDPDAPVRSDDDASPSGGTRIVVPPPDDGGLDLSSAPPNQTSEEPAPVADQATGDDVSPTPGPALIPTVDSPCSVRVGPSPAAGDVAFATIDLPDLDQDSIDVVGPDGTSALLDGFADSPGTLPRATVPFVLDRSMLDGGSVQGVTATLADGRLVPCWLSNRAIPAPCALGPISDLSAGDRTEVEFVALGVWRRFRNSEVELIGADGQSALIGRAASATFIDADLLAVRVTSDTVDPATPPVRMVFADGAASFSCEVF